MTDLTFSDLAEQAGGAAEEAAAEAAGESTGEWVTELVQTLDKRGLLEPLLFGPDGTAELQDQRQEARETADDDASGEGLNLDAGSIADAGRALMGELGEDVTVAEVVQICEKNPQLVDQQIEEHLGA